MKKKLLCLGVVLCCLLLLGGLTAASEISDPILKKLVEKGVLTKEEAMSVLEEMNEEKAKKEQHVKEKLETQTNDTKSTTNNEYEKIANALKGFKFGLLWYLSYMDGEGKDIGGSAGDGEHRNRFAIKRGYFRVTKELLPWFDAHITFDTTQVKDEDSSLEGSIDVRIKYAYAKFKMQDFAFFTKPYVEVGIVHMPWLDYEEHVNWYRCQDTMFIERNSTFNSADFGLTFVSLLGGEIGEEYQKKVNDKYPGRYGSTAFGVYNGGGYHASEKNDNKVFEGRLTLRPLPDIIPGLQLSYFGLTGKGNTSDEPDWNVNLVMLSFEHEYVVLTGQYYDGKGNQAGKDEYDKDGYSIFAEIKPMSKVSLIGRYDYFDPNDKADDDENTRYIVGFAYHLDKPHKNMVLLDYDTVDYKDKNKKDDKRIQLTLQVAL